jgi:hypothetical protein
MSDSLVVASSFDSTRYTAVHARDDHPNLAQAQAEAVTSLLLGRTLGINNTYAFDSRTVLNLTGAILQTRDQVREAATTAVEKQRIDTANPFKLRWFGKENESFFDCCANQLRRLATPGRLVLSHWKKIDGNDAMREGLAAELTAETPRFPHSIKAIDYPRVDGIGELEQSFQTLIAFNKYCQDGDRGRRSGQSHISLLGYIEVFEGLDRKELLEVMDGKIDIDTVMHLRESISEQPAQIKGARSWAHGKVEEAGGEDACDEFLLQQRQLIDTLYNEVLADSVGSDHDLLSSVPRTVGNEKLEQVNEFALNLIRFTKQRRPGSPPAADRIEVPGSFDARTDMSELFVAAGAEPDLPASPLRVLLVAYWQLIADDRSLAWRESCEHLEYSLQRALQIRARGLVDSQFSEAWQAHLDMLQAQLPHVKAYETNLTAAIELSGKNYYTRSGFGAQSPANDTQADSLAAGQYIDRYLRGVMR